MIHPSLLFLDGHFETTLGCDFTHNPIHMILYYFPVLKAQDVRHSALASRSLATWPSQMQPNCMHCRGLMEIFFPVSFYWDVLQFINSLLLPNLNARPSLIILHMNRTPSHAYFLAHSFAHMHRHGSRLQLIVL